MEINTEVYNIYFDRSANIVVMEWDGYATSRQFREGTELMLNTLIKHDTGKVLADVKDMLMIGMEDQQWLVADFLPRAIKFGFKAIAIVKPDYYFNKVAIESISDRMNEGLALKIFDTVEQAKLWLENV
ncbi:MAG: STAS/SEC14 domain-containing protein [Flavobacterium sp.]